MSVYAEFQNRIFMNIFAVTTVGHIIPSLMDPSESQRFHIQQRSRIKNQRSRVQLTSKSFCCLLDWDNLRATRLPDKTNRVPLYRTFSSNTLKYQTARRRVNSYKFFYFFLLFADIQVNLPSVFYPNNNINSFETESNIK